MRIGEVLLGVRTRHVDPLERFIENGNDAPLLAQRWSSDNRAFDFDLRNVQLRIPNSLRDQFGFLFKECIIKEFWNEFFIWKYAANRLICAGLDTQKSDSTSGCTIHSNDDSILGNTLAAEFFYPSSVMNLPHRVISPWATSPLTNQGIFPPS